MASTDINLNKIVSDIVWKITSIDVSLKTILANIEQKTLDDTGQKIALIKVD